MNKKGKIVVGISLGDINGVGIEVILKSFEDKRMLEFCTPLLFGSSKVISFHKKILSIETNIHEIKSIQQIRDGEINLLNIWDEEVKLELGKGTKTGGQYAFKSLSEATKALKKGEIDILITAPINKETIQSEEFNFSGHTEFLEHNLEGESLMILMNDFLRIGLITGHIPISKIAESITPELIESPRGFDRIGGRTSARGVGQVDSRSARIDVVRRTNQPFGYSGHFMVGKRT